MFTLWMERGIRRSLLALVVALAIVGDACAGDDSSNSASSDGGDSAVDSAVDSAIVCDAPPLETDGTLTVATGEPVLVPSDKARGYPNRMSSGQNQRAAVVRVLMTDPGLLLLDEVTSALDPDLAGEVLSVIREFAAGDITMVMATQDMGFACEVACTVCFLHQGEVLEPAPPDQLFLDPVHDRTKHFLQRVTQAGRL